MGSSWVSLGFRTAMKASSCRTALPLADTLLLGDCHQSAVVHTSSVCPTSNRNPSKMQHSAVKRDETPWQTYENPFKRDCWYGRTALSAVAVRTSLLSVQRDYNQHTSRSLATNDVTIEQEPMKGLDSVLLCSPWRCKAIPRLHRVATRQTSRRRSLGPSVAVRSRRQKVRRCGASLVKQMQVEVRPVRSWFKFASPTKPPASNV